MACEVVQKSGAFFSYNDDRLGQGRANARAFLHDNADLADAIEAQIRERAGLPPAPLPTPGAAAAKAASVAAEAAAMTATAPIAPEPEVALE